MMSDDFSVFWHNNEQASALFYDLLARSEQDAYDEDFLARLAAYREADGDAAHADIFAAQYLLANGDAENAVTCAERAFRLRPLQVPIFEVLSRAYKMLGRYADALLMQGYTNRLTDVPIAVDDYPHEAITQEALDRLSVVLSHPSFVPLATRASYDPAAGITTTDGLFAGEFLPASESHDRAYYVGVHAEQGQQGDKAWQLKNIRDAQGVGYFAAGDFIFDLMRAQRAPGAAHIELAPGQEVVLPIIGTVLPAVGVCQPQQLHVHSASVDAPGWLNVATPNFYRLHETTDFSSDHAFLVGTPIQIGHHPRRRRLVLNILVDALPWEIVGSCFAEMMPQTARFFARGLIFNQQFSVSEYTYPSLATIETGLYPHHSKMFHDKIPVELSPSIATLSERARDNGYATAQLMGFGMGLYDGCMRGYDRLIAAMYRTPAYEGTERIIRHLDGIPDADHFIYFHTADVHPWPAPLFQQAATVQASLPLDARMTDEIHAPHSPYLRPSPINQASFRYGVRSTDRALGTLFSYLEEHYAPEEYLVNLYSDHGVSIFSPTPYIVDSPLTHTAWMMRGAGIPEGVITEELTSTADIHPTMAHLLGFPGDADVDGVLPRVLGGSGRDVSFSNSLYPGKPYFLAVRSASHTLCLETEVPVHTDGTVDLARASIAIYPREHEREKGYEIDDPALRAFFYPRARDFLRGIASNGEAFSPLKES